SPSSAAESTLPTLLEQQIKAAYRELTSLCTSGDIASNESKLQEPCDLLLGTTTGALRVVYLLDTLQDVPPSLKEKLVEQGAASSDPNIRDLFERYLPEKRRVQR